VGLFDFVYGPSEETLHRRRLELARERNKPMWEVRPSEAATVQGILERAENHLAVLKGMNSSKATITAQEEYINAAKLLLTRLY